MQIRFLTLPITFLLALFFAATTTHADTYEHERTWTPLGDYPAASRGNCANKWNNQVGRAGYINRIFFKYDNITKRFEAEIEFEECVGRLPKGFWLAINDGPNPKGHAGELALLYFDATDLNNPILSVYAYNGSNGFESYKDGQAASGRQTPDRIISSHPLAANNNFASLEVTSGSRANGDGSTSALRTFKVDMDASIIQGHDPLYPAVMPSWTGIAFDSSIGYWFHHFVQSDGQYCTDGDGNTICQDVATGQDSKGFLKSITPGITGYVDTSNQTANTYPYCTGAFTGQTKYDATKGCYEVEIGNQFHSTITAQDQDAYDTGLILNYTAPTGAVVDFSSSNPSAGGNYSIDNPGIVDMYFTPELSHSGARVTADFEFTDTKGATKSCPVDICVPVNNPPVCDIQITSANPGQCAGEITTIDFDANGSYDPEGKGITYQWTTDCTGSVSLTDKNNGQSSISVTEPGDGLAYTGCSVTLTVSDGINNDVSCSAPIDIQPCDLDCLDVPNGTAVVDQCGVCNGNNDCLDCADIPNGGTQVDQCGVCGGSNDCLDCAGTVNGDKEYDQCNVCDGDNTSCLDCEDRDITEIQFLIDGGAKKLEAIINQILFKIRKQKSKKLQNFISETQEQAHALQTRNWIISWLFPSISSDCGATPFCATVSNVDLIEEYRVHDKELLELGYEVAKKVFRIKRRKAKSRGVSSKKLRRFGQARKRYRKQLLDQYNKNENNLNMVPESFSSCS